jgi:hypothetical protein
VKKKERLKGFVVLALSGGERIGFSTERNCQDWAAKLKRAAG